MKLFSLIPIHSAGVHILSKPVGEISNVLKGYILVGIVVTVSMGTPERDA